MCFVVVVVVVVVCVWCGNRGGNRGHEENY